MTTTPELPRTERLRRWMAEHYITDAALGDKLNISTPATNKFLNSDVMPVKLPEKCLELGFPLELLPAPFDRPRGRRPKTPNFPGLTPAQVEA